MVMYKSRFVFMVVFLFMIVFARGQKIDSVVIIYEDMWIDHCKAITCSEFGISNNDCQKATISEPAKIDEFMKVLRELPYDTIREHYNVYMDTRAQIYIYRNNCNCTSMICMDIFGALIGYKYFAYSRDFLRVLSQYIPKKYLPVFK